MINNKKTSNYNLKMEKAIFNDLDKVFDRHKQKNTPETLIVDILKKYIESK